MGRRRQKCWHHTTLFQRLQYRRVEGIMQVDHGCPVPVVLMSFRSAVVTRERAPDRIQRSYKVIVISKVVWQNPNNEASDRRIDSR